MATVANAHQRYWEDPRIHTFGNIGVRGFVHALIAPSFTRGLDGFFGEEVRARMHAQLRGDKVVDLGCGTGLSTPPGAIGVDTSFQMLAVAQMLARPQLEKTFVHGNAESWGEGSGICDTALVSFVLHEAPFAARTRILANALRIARKRAIVMDIHPAFTPTKSMLMGEPFIENYLAGINYQIYKAGANVHEFEFGNGRVKIWVLEKLSG
jgi:ubiquinone/menaquinone biosynthesis C-methylase UbiE